MKTGLTLIALLVVVVVGVAGLLTVATVLPFKKARRTSRVVTQELLKPIPASDAKSTVTLQNQGTNTNTRPNTCAIEEFSTCK